MIGSLVPPERSVLIVNNGAYGERMLRIARAHGIKTEALTYDNIMPVEPADVDAASKDMEAVIAAFSSSLEELTGP